MESKEHSTCKRLATQQDINNLYLPNEILENIISFLPLKEAIKFGILSKRFEESWLYSRNLNFDRVLVTGQNRKNLAKIVNKVFDYHLRPEIKSFSLCIKEKYADKSSVEIWVKKAMQKGVEELDLDFFPHIIEKDQHCFSADLFDFESLRVLKLTNCSINIKLPSKFNFLKTLVLRLVHVKLEMVDALFSSCKLLENLGFDECTGYLRISAGYLKTFKELNIINCDVIHIDVR
ncbi:putative FBD-associated F-box protein At1g61330 [Mercurialis annua]|uniref:putative FBD-associated F-box protein At1g61330 n=1 Tax=Mercurialis annua TaxID=3986 RepID=UPI00215E4F1C|nr:putative FBD-associated F-box protein At1g61330 [Mercurialis annua]